jgi:hypothetical protein
MNTKNPARGLAMAVLSLLLALVAGACTSKGGHVSSAKSAAASVTANPTVAAELDQAKLLVKTCFAGTPLQQARQVHLVFLSSAAGKHGPEVVAARDKTFSCLGINDPAKRQAFLNDAITAAGHGHLTTHDGRVTYFSVTLPQLVLKHGGTAAGVGTSTAQPSIPGTTANASAS